MEGEAQFDCLIVHGVLQDGITNIQQLIMELPLLENKNEKSTLLAESSVRGISIRNIEEVHVGSVEMASVVHLNLSKMKNYLAKLYKGQKCLGDSSSMDLATYRKHSEQSK